MLLAGVGVGDAVGEELEGELGSLVVGWSPAPHPARSRPQKAAVAKAREVNPPESSMLNTVSQAAHPCEISTGVVGSLLDSSLPVDNSSEPVGSTRFGPVGHAVSGEIHSCVCRLVALPSASPWR